MVNQARHIQHNPQTHEGSEGLEQLFKRLSQTNPKVNMVRGFEDGDYVFAQMEYDFSSPKICFEVFRFENGQAVEHWDNIQPRPGPNPSNHTMVDGSTALTDLDKTQTNRDTIRNFVETVLIGKETDKLHHALGKIYTEHNPHPVGRPKRS